MIRLLLKLPIFKRLIPSLSIRYFKFSKKNIGYFKIKNIKFYLDFLDPIDREIILFQEYENDQVLFLENKIKKNHFSYFLDIGANSGYYSFYFASKFKNLKIKAFEPNYNPYKKFKKTLKKILFKILKYLILGCLILIKELRLDLCLKMELSTQTQQYCILVVNLKIVNS